MNDSIWKYNLAILDEQVVKLPIHSVPLSVGEQNEALYVWIRVDSDFKETDFTFSIRGTGHRLTGNEGDFLGTVVMSYGLVWHVFWKQ
jgi:hypothetical protein